MRFIVVVVDGRAVAGEGGLWSALEAAETPTLDRLGAEGRVGAAALTPVGSVSSPRETGFGLGLLTLLGYPPASLAGLSGAVLDAAARGVGLGGADWAMRARLVGVSPDDREGLMLDEPGVSGDEADAVFDDLVAHWREACPHHAERLELVGTGRDRLLIDHGAASASETDPIGYQRVETADPALLTGEPWVEHLPDGGDPRASDRLCMLISASRHALAEHPVNSARAEQGLTPANLVWLWGPGTPAGLGPMGTSALAPEPGLFVDESARESPAVGAARLVGLAPEPPGALAMLGPRLVESTDETVVAAVSAPIDRVDRELLGPVVAGLEAGHGSLETGEAGWRLLVAVSHDPGARPAEGAGGEDAAGLDAGGMTPFVLAGGWVRSVVPRRLCHGLGSDLLVDPGCELLEYVLRAGLRGRV